MIRTLPWPDVASPDLSGEILRRKMRRKMRRLMRRLMRPLLRALSRSAMGDMPPTARSS